MATKKAAKAELKKGGSKKAAASSKPAAAKVATVAPAAPEPFLWRPSRSQRLEVGDLIEMLNRRRYFIAYVNESRARAIPITADVKEVIVGQGEDHVKFSFTGHGIDISPNSIVKHVSPEELTPDEAIRAARFAEMEMSRTMTPEEIEVARREQMAATAEAPLPAATTNKLNKVSDKMKKISGAGEKAKTTKRAAGQKVPGEKKQKAAKVLKPCACGCGEQTTAYFVPGHDARFKGWLLKIERGQMHVEDLPKVVQKSYEWKKRGNGFIPTKNYRGEVHHGYDVD